MVIWLIGLSGAGKTTIGREVHRRLKSVHPNTVFVDGDEVRAVFAHDRGPDAYTPAGRARNAERMAELCAWLDRQGMHVVCCCLSIFEETRAWNRAHYGRYLEVLVDVPWETLVAERDYKGLYAAALRGECPNVVGVDIPWTPPAAPDLTLINDGAQGTPAELADRVLDRARAIGLEGV